MAKLHVAVVGAGVIGLSVATHLLEEFSDHLQVIIIADKFSPNTDASDRSGGWFFPPSQGSKCPGNPEREARWTKGTFDRMHKLYNSAECSKIGLSVVDGYLASNHPVTPGIKPLWSDFVIGYRIAEESELKLCECEGRTLLAFTTFIIPCPTYLPWLLDKFIQLGGVSEQRKINNLSELGSYDVVINCTGLGARELVNDQKMYSVRGHIVSVKAPWLKQWHIRHESDCDRVAYIFPRTNEVLLGGTHEIYNEDLSQVDQDQIQGILDRCQKTVPGLVNAEIKDTWVGIRPMREGGVRLEKENGGEGRVIIHCYGHGGDGVTLSWGCAEEVGSLVKECIKDKGLVSNFV